MLSGPLTAATVSRPRYGLISSDASCSDIATAAIAPDPLVDAMTSPRRTATVIAWSSPRLPAAKAAPISPTLCPTTASGVMPQDRHSSTSAACTATMAAWAISVSVSREDSRGAHSSASNDHPPSSRVISSQRRSTRALTGSASSPRPISAHWLPWPLKTMISRRRSSGTTLASEAAAGCAPCATSPSSSAAASFDAAVTANRTGRCVRRRAAVRTTSANAGASPLARSLWYDSAFARRAASVRPESSSASGRGSLAAGSSAGGACSSTTCALVPLKPKELTPAMRGPSHSVSSVGTSTGTSSQRTCSLGRSKCRCGGIRPWCSDSATLIRLDIPAAASRCPRLVFTEPTRSLAAGSRSGRSTSTRASISIGSPSCVPVPWAST